MIHRCPYCQPFTKEVKEMNATEETIKFTSDYYLRVQRSYCEQCSLEKHRRVLEWHLLKNDGTWECLGCRSK